MWVPPASCKGRQGKGGCLIWKQCKCPPAAAARMPAPQASTAATSAPAPSSSCAMRARASELMGAACPAACLQVPPSAASACSGVAPVTAARMSAGKPPSLSSSSTMLGWLASTCSTTGRRLALASFHPWEGADCTCLLHPQGALAQGPMQEQGAHRKVEQGHAGLAEGLRRGCGVRDGRSSRSQGGGCLCRQLLVPGTPLLIATGQVLIPQDVSVQALIQQLLGCTAQKTLSAGTSRIQSAWRCLLPLSPRVRQLASDINDVVISTTQSLMGAQGHAAAS